MDTDVLPTMLVYRGGELIHSWVRVDWEANMGVEELLRRCVSYYVPSDKPSTRSPLVANRHHVLAEGGGSDGNCGLPSDDDGDDLVFSGSDDGYDL